MPFPGSLARPSATLSPKWEREIWYTNEIIPAQLLHDRLHQVNDRIRQAAERAQRAADAICLVAVTKTLSEGLINEAIALGLKDLGENRIQEAESKREKLGGQGIRHHLLGSLQTNKARRAVQLFDLIQSVDRPKLAHTLNRIAGEEGKKQACLIEVKISSEETKQGLPEAEAKDFIQSFEQYKNLDLKGLMTLAPFEAGEKDTREKFRLFHDFFVSQKPYLGENPILSMGMTDDFEWAIEEGSTMVRLGRALFGERT